MTSIPRQLALLVFVSLSVTGVASAVLAVTAKRSADASESMITGSMASLARANTLMTTVARTQSDLQQTLRLKDPDELEAKLAQIEAGQKESAKLVAACGSAAPALRTAMDAVNKENAVVLDRVLHGDLGGANEALISTANPQFDALQQALGTYYDSIQSQTAKDIDAQQGAQERTLLFTLGVVAIALAGLAFYGWRLRNQISDRLRSLASRLSDTSTQVASGSEVVTNSSNSLAKGATQQAGAIQQTSASLEEMSSRTTQNANHARKTKELTSVARVAADEGAESITALGQAMGEISEASNGISKILKTIEDIAFQTNILALNAAVEAARAGDAGMGFAVVAEEVRRLAHRSAEAAKDTASRIDVSIARSHKGAELTGKVSESLRAIVGQVRQVDELVSQVATASAEQSVGISQVNIAVGQMGSVTQSTAATAEESASAAVELRTQVVTLESAVAELQQMVGRAA
jgi:methyl-accepting chemotaxis protein